MIHIDNSTVESAQIEAFGSENAMLQTEDSTSTADNILNIPVLSGSTDSNGGKSENSIVDIKGNVAIDRLLDIDRLYIGTENIKANLNVTQEQNLSGSNKKGKVYVQSNSIFTLKGEAVDIDTKTNKIATEKTKSDDKVTSNVASSNKIIDLSALDMKALKESVASTTRTLDTTYNLEQIATLTVDLDSGKSLLKLSNTEYEFTGVKEALGIQNGLKASVVCRIIKADGTTKGTYSTLKDGFGNAENNCTIEVLGDCSGGGQELKIAENITVTLASSTTSNVTINFSKADKITVPGKATLNIKNIIIDGGGADRKDESLRTEPLVDVYGTCNLTNTTLQHAYVNSYRVSVLRIGSNGETKGIANLNNGARITDNMGNNKGDSAVTIFGGILNMYDGSLIDNNYGRVTTILIVNENEKDAVSIFNMYGGQITKNYTELGMSAIDIYSGCTFNMRGGTIKENGTKGTYEPYAIAVKKGGIMNVSGNITVKDNYGGVEKNETNIYKSGSEGNIGLIENTIINVDGNLDENSKLGVYVNSANHKTGHEFAKAANESIASSSYERFSDDYSTYGIALKNTDKTYIQFSQFLLDNVFLDSSKDNTNAGDTPARAVATFDTAKSILKNGGIIWISGEVKVTDEQTWSLADRADTSGTETKYAVVKRWDGNKDILPDDSKTIDENISPFIYNMVNISGDGNLTLENITLDGNKENVTNTIQAVVAVIDTNSKLTMQSGSLICNNENVMPKNNKNEIYGGGIYVLNGNLTMDSGSAISDNGSENCFSGGGIAMFGKAEVIIGEGAVIKNNTATLGGGISIYTSCIDAKLTVEQGAKITENIGVLAGGGIGIHQIDNSADISISGTISGNQAPQGSAINVYFDYGKVTLSETTITGNNTTSNISDDNNNRTGGAIYSNGPALNVKGNVKVIDNVNNGTADTDNDGDTIYTGTVQDNIYLPDTKYITVAGALSGGNKSIGVTPSDNSKFKLVAKPDSGYTISDDDMAAFVHDRVTNKIKSARPIKRGIGTTGDNIPANLVLGSNMIKVTVPTEYLFAGVPNVFGDEIVAPNYTITNNSEDSKLKVEVAFENENNDGTTNKNSFLVADSTAEEKLNGSTIEKPDKIELYLSKPENNNDSDNNGFFIVDNTGTAPNATAEKTNLLSQYNDINGTSATSVFTLGILDGTTGTAKNSGSFTFTGKIGDYDILDMDLNLHSKFKMIFKFTSI